MIWQQNIKRLRTPGRRRRQANKPSASLSLALSLLKAGSVVLDLGCGESGDRQIARRKGMEAYGLDILPVSQHDGFVQANCVALPFADHSFDAVICHAMIALVSPWDRWALFDEAARVLKPNGVLSLTGYPLTNGFGFNQLGERWRINAVGFHYVRAGLFRRCVEHPCPQHPAVDSFQFIQEGVASLCGDNDSQFIKTGSIFVSLLAVGLERLSEFTGYLADDIADVLDGMINAGILIDAHDGTFDLPWLASWERGDEAEGNLGFCLDTMAIYGAVQRQQTDNGPVYAAPGVEM